MERGGAVNDWGNMFEQKIIHQQKEQNRREHQIERIQEIGLHTMIGNSMRERKKEE
jgi:hypothetical protein